MSLELKLIRPDRVYRPPDVLDGTLVISTSSTLSHQGVRLTAVGTIMLQLSAKSVGVFEVLYNSVKPIQLLNKTVDISPAGKLPPGVTEVWMSASTSTVGCAALAMHFLNGNSPFKGLSGLQIPFHVALDVPKGGPFEVLFETYHGAYVNIQYLLTADVVRGYLQKSLSATTEFIVECPQGKLQRSIVSSDYVNFYITQDTQKHALLPVIRSGGFRVMGKIATQCVLTEPILGELVVEKSAVPIQSIDIQLLRVESVAASDRMATESSEVQTTQIADGDLCRGLTVPIYIILPRLTTCPSLSVGAFSLEFELVIMISFDGGLRMHPMQYELAASKQMVELALVRERSHVHVAREYVNRGKQESSFVMRSCEVGFQDLATPLMQGSAT